MSIVLYSVLLTLSGEPRYLYTDYYGFSTVQQCESFYSTEPEEVLNGLLLSARDQYIEEVVVSEVGCGLLHENYALEPVVTLYSKEGEAL
jgi:hypothetical protein